VFHTTPIKILRNESGQVLVLSALSMTCLLGLLAFATDVGTLLYERREMQTAADSAAIAGAAEIKYAASDGTTVDAVAKTAAAQNGFTHGANGVTITVNNGPVRGTKIGNGNYVEVVIQESAPVFFMKLFGFGSMNVAARAVAGQSPSKNCIYTLGPTGTDISITGSGTLTLSGCNMLVDSSSASAVSDVGSAIISAKSVGIVGGYSIVGSGSISPAPVTGMTAVGDPLSYLPEPAIPGTCSSAVSFVGSSTYALSPGCYAGLSVVGSGTLNLSPGLYIFTGNVSFSGSSIINGTGVTLYTTGTTSMTGSGVMNLSAPTFGTYNGILLYQSRTDTASISFTGSAGTNVQGIIYAPSAGLTFTGSGSGNFYASIVTKSMTLTGSANIQDYSVVNSSTPLSYVKLAE
jgi:Flp pilus assembly protein TadG